ncbi:MAG: hypothetical protein M8354_13450 [Halalkalicoccus sp.]|nr:hypothetical protein [Halalkalicoccus sp.]
MAALWTYPWTMAQEGLDDACKRIVDLGIDALNVPSHYHSVRSMQPRFLDSLFESVPGGCHFSPTDRRFGDESLEPPVVEIDGFEDPLAEIADVAHEHGLSINAWTVCLHNSRLGAANPSYRIESAFGDAHDHSPCPSHPEVHDYFAAVVEASVARSADEIHLESIGFPSAFHGHGIEFGHDKRQALTDSTETVLLSQCFCDGCQQAAKSHHVDFDRAKARVRELLEASFATPGSGSRSLEDLVCEDELLRSLFDFRATVIETFVECLADAAGTVPLNYYVAESSGGADPDGVWPSGVRLGQLDAFFDRATAMCYVSDPSIARDRVRTLRGSVDCPIDAGVTLDPAVIETLSELRSLVVALEGQQDGRISFYHHSLMTDAHLRWVKSAINQR